MAGEDYDGVVRWSWLPLNDVELWLPEQLGTPPGSQYLTVQGMSDDGRRIIVQAATRTAGAVAAIHENGAWTVLPGAGVFPQDVNDHGVAVGRGPTGPVIWK